MTDLTDLIERIEAEVLEAVKPMPSEIAPGLKCLPDARTKALGEALFKVAEALALVAARLKAREAGDA